MEDRKDLELRREVLMEVKNSESYPGWLAPWVAWLTRILSRANSHHALESQEFERYLAKHILRMNSICRQLYATDQLLLGQREMVISRTFGSQTQKGLRLNLTGLRSYKSSDRWLPLDFANACFASENVITDNGLGKGLDT